MPTCPLRIAQFLSRLEVIVTAAQAKLVLTSTPMLDLLRNTVCPYLYIGNHERTKPQSHSLPIIGNASAKISINDDSRAFLSMFLERQKNLKR